MRLLPSAQSPAGRSYGPRWPIFKGGWRRHFDAVKPQPQVELAHAVRGLLGGRQCGGATVEGSGFVGLVEAAEHGGVLGEEFSMSFDFWHELEGVDDVRGALEGDRLLILGLEALISSAELSVVAGAIDIFARQCACEHRLGLTHRQ